MKDMAQRITRCFTSPLKPALKVAIWIISITVPVSFLVFILKFLGWVEIIASFFEPLFSLMNLPGESALVFITSCLLNIYSAIAVIGTLDLSGHATTVLALMCLFSHSLPVEVSVQKKTGTSAILILCLRLSASFFAGGLLNHLLPQTETITAATKLAESHPITGSFISDIIAWLKPTALICAEIILIVVALMILQKFMEEFGIMKILSSIMKYPLKILGIPKRAAFLWIVANTLGLTYGSGVLIDQARAGTLDKNEQNILNYHIALSHSLLEDTLLFVAIGVSPWWIIIPRLILATAVVWTARLKYWLGSQTRPLAESTPT